MDEIKNMVKPKKKRGEIDFEEAFHTKSLHRIYNLDYFLEKNNYFEKGDDQISALYRAI
jgi:hypothetical protein